MKILVLSSYDKSLINFRGPLLKALVKAGNVVVACAPGWDVAVVKELEDMGVSFQSIPLKRAEINPIGDIYALFSLYRLMRKQRPDMVFAYTIKPVIYGSLAARLAGVRDFYSMITGLGNTFHRKSFLGSLLHDLICRLYRFGLKRNKLVFFQNPDDRETFLKLNLIAKNTDTILVNGSGVDLDHYGVVPIATDPLVFLLLARIISEKGIEQYVEAAKQLKKRYPKVNFRLVGQFESSPWAIPRDRVMAWHKQGIIEYSESVDDVRPLMAAASVYVLPTYYREGTPRTVLEAMSMGRPVITTDTPGCRETVRQSNGAGWKIKEKGGHLKIGCNGILFPAKDVPSLVEAMEYFLLNPEQIERMGKESRLYAEERYDVHQVNAVMLRAMELRP